MRRIPQPPSGQPQPKKKQGEHSPASLENPFDANVGEHHHSVQGGIHRWSGPNHLGLKGNEYRITRVGRSRGQTQPRRAGIRHTSVLDLEAVDDRGHREVPTKCHGAQEQQPLPVHLAQPSQREAPHRIGMQNVAKKEQQTMQHADREQSEHSSFVALWIAAGQHDRRAKQQRKQRHEFALKS